MVKHGSHRYSGFRNRYGIDYFRIVLLLLDVKSRGSMETQWGKFSGPVWFIFLAFGIVLQVVGVMSSI